MLARRILPEGSVNRRDSTMARAGWDAAKAPRCKFVTMASKKFARIDFAGRNLPPRIFAGKVRLKIRSQIRMPS
jgi:hypothetical protein